MHEAEDCTVLVVRRMSKEVFDVITGSENIGLPHQEDDTNLCILFRLKQRISKGCVHRGRQRISCPGDSA